MKNVVFRVGDPSVWCDQFVDPATHRDRFCRCFVFAPRCFSRLSPCVLTRTLLRAVRVVYRSSFGFPWMTSLLCCGIEGGDYVVNFVSSEWTLCVVCPSVWVPSSTVIAPADASFLPISPLLSSLWHGGHFDVSDHRLGTNNNVQDVFLVV